MTIERGGRPTSPVHVHVDDQTPVHVHVKKPKKSTLSKAVEVCQTLVSALMYFMLKFEILLTCRI